MAAANTSDMKTQITLIALFTLCLSARCQYIINFNIQPEHPTINDSVQIAFALTVTDGGLRLSNNLLFSGDTFYYQGCYICYCFEQTDEEIDDTIQLRPLSEGVYHVHILTRFARARYDTACSTSDVRANDTIDTFFVVSAVNSFDAVNNEPFGAYLLNYNKLVILPDKETEFAVCVYNVTGKLCLPEFKSELRQGQNVIDIPTGNLLPGLYFYRLRLGGRQKIIRFIVN